MSRVGNLKNLFEQAAARTTESDRRIATGLAATAASKPYLPTGDLIAAGFTTTRNPLLQNIWHGVETYNRTAPVTLCSLDETRRKLVQLDDLMKYSAEYLTSKWPETPSTGGSDPKRNKRWAALEGLLDHVIGEMGKLGGLALNGPTNWRD